MSSETHDVGFEIVKYVSKVNMEYGLYEQVLKGHQRGYRAGPVKINVKDA